MKIKVKSIKQNQFEIHLDQIDPTVIDLKKRIIQLKKIENQSLKLIFKGGILSDSTKLSDHDIKEGDLITYMTTKINPFNTEKQNLNYINDNSCSFSENLKESFDSSFNESVDFTDVLLSGNDGDESFISKLLSDDEELEDDENFSDLSSSFIEEDCFKISEDNLIESIASIIKVMMNKESLTFEEVISNLFSKFPEFSEVLKDNLNEIRILSYQPITHHDKSIYKEFKQTPNYTILSVDNESDTDEKSVVKIITQKDRKEIKKLSLLGFSEKKCEDVYFQCKKDKDLALRKLLNEK